MLPICATLRGDWSRAGTCIMVASQTLRRQRVERAGDYVFFVTFGQEQGGHAFEEGITPDGVLTWQSQPRQDFAHPQIREFIQHDELTHTIHLCLRKGGAFHKSQWKAPPCF